MAKQDCVAVNTSSIHRYSVSGEWARFTAPPEDIHLNTTVLLFLELL
jgi:hypothetical protein